MNDVKKLSQFTLAALLSELVDHIIDGWAVSDDEPEVANIFGGAYSVTIYRTEATVNSLKQRVDAVQTMPKRTPQERMAYARAQRGKGKLDVNTLSEDN